MRHAGWLTRNCKLDRKGSSMAIRVTLPYFWPAICTFRLFAALNNQKRIRGAVARIGRSHFSPFEIQCDPFGLVTRLPYSIFIAPFQNFSNFSEISFLHVEKERRGFW